jgi:hypothetical protein
MLDPRRFPWRDQLILTRELPVAGDRTEFYTRASGGEFTALRRGVYMRTDAWSQLNPDAQHRARVYAAVEYAKSDPVVSHVSAVSLWRLPWFSGYPRTVHVLGKAESGGRSTSSTVRHAVGSPAPIVWIDGVRTTSLARTVVDVGSTASFAQAVAVADAALRRTVSPVDEIPPTTLTRADLISELENIPVAHGSAKALRALEFSDGAADSPGESISRVNMSLARLTAPELQAPLHGASGRLWHVDFWWPRFNLIGEFDGKTKYVDEQYLQGKSANEMVYQEKLREDDLRAAGHAFTRWPWRVANDVPALRAHLVAAGLR